MSRVRIKDESKLKTWEDVDNALKEIAENELDIIDLEGEMNKQIQGIKQIAALEVKPYHDRIDALGKEIKLFVEDHRAELDGKTKFMNFGKTGYRFSTSVSLPKAKDKLASIIKMLKSKKMNDCIIVTETVNKDVLRKYPEDEIVKIGASLKKVDTFWYETDKEKLQRV